MNSIVYTSSVNKNNSLWKNDKSTARRCIDNTITGANKCIGYCEYMGHPGFLTKNLIIEHNCIKKGCHYFISKPKKEKSLESADKSSAILSYISDILSDNEAVKVINVEKSEENKYIANYISITTECHFSDCLEKVYEELKVKLDFVRMNYSFENCVALICNGL